MDYFYVPVNQKLMNNTLLLLKHLSSLSKAWLRCDALLVKGFDKLALCYAISFNLCILKYLSKVHIIKQSTVNKTPPGSFSCHPHVCLAREGEANQNGCLELHYSIFHLTFLMFLKKKTEYRFMSFNMYLYFIRS